MQYTEEQLSEIKKRIELLEGRLEKLDKYEEESLRERMQLGKEINELSKLLLGEPIKENNDDIIGLGSKFNMTLSSEGFDDETDDYVISETHIKIPGFFPVTPLTPLGKAVIGRKVGETFEYESDGILNKGTINTIYRVVKEAPKQKAIVK